MNVKEIRELVRILSGTDVTEFDLETEGTKITIKKGHPMQVAPVGAPINLPVPQHYAYQAPPAAPAAPAATRPEAPEEEQSLGANQFLIVAPMVGTFYRAPSPGADPYVQTGEVVEAGQVVCIIEAMKLMNEIESEMKGKILEILVENGQPVEYGQPLFLLEKA